MISSNVLKSFLFVPLTILKLFSDETEKSSDLVRLENSFQVKEKGFLTIALTPDPKSQNLGVVLNETSRPIVLIIGSEGFGLSTNSLTAADCSAKIPMHNNVDSLNVATSLAIALYAVQN